MRSFAKIYAVLAIGLILMVGYDIWILGTGRLDFNRHFPGLFEVYIISWWCFLRKIEACDSTKGWGGSCEKR